MDYIKNLKKSTSNDVEKDISNMEENDAADLMSIEHFLEGETKEQSTNSKQEGLPYYEVGNEIRISITNLKETMI